ncbi:hypothetical protein GLOIN_2v1572272 [Rhizophagus clarus]|uniref:Granulins domain-containing protein n=1 Tax=Rhizophagus clarus TaxID=94130 RepID=A0A8H3KVY3_9GLOM|nr:hypothetical protein GLOIN_2v1572272 [Rhizophagus clarus]
MKNFILILFLGILVFGNFSSAINPLKWKRADCGDGIVCGNGCCDIFNICCGNGDFCCGDGYFCCGITAVFRLSFNDK